MKHFKPDFKFHIGLRNIKTALAATVVALVYLLIGRDPTFACIGAIFGTGSDMKNSRLHGGNRFFGTIFGGVLGMLLFRFYILFHPEGLYPDYEFHWLMLVLLFVGVVALILVSQFFWVGAIQPGGVMLCIILFRTPVETYISYSLNRIVDTGIGVLVALLLNYLLPRERLVAWFGALGFRRHRDEHRANREKQTGQEVIK